ncbi:MAG: hypothetical protein P8Z00_21475 [Anaerolineales bacterium]
MPFNACWHRAAWLLLDIALDRTGMLGDFPLETGRTEYLLFVDKKAVGLLEAKAEGIPPSTASEQAGQYELGCPPAYLT